MNAGASPNGSSGSAPSSRAQPQLRLHRRFHSRILRNCRDVTVWLPPGYGSDPRRRYPVVYFQDGPEVFAPGSGWRAGEGAFELVRQRRIVAPILVGVGPSDVPREHEFAPTPSDYADVRGLKQRSPGDAKRYARFFTTELMPYIASHYRVLPGARSTALVGAGLAGLASLYFAAWHPRDFGAVAALSPTLNWDNRIALRDFSVLRKKPEARLWLDTGTAEAGWEVTQNFRDTLVGRGWVLGADFSYREIAGAKATAEAWGARLGDVLLWLLPRTER